MTGTRTAVQDGWAELAAGVVAAGCVLASAALARAEDAAADANRMDPVAYCEIRELRTTLCLTDDVLAAMGCGREQAETMLTALVTWHGTTQAQRDAVAAEKRDTLKPLREAMQKMNMGPRDEALIARIPGLQRAYEEALRKEADLARSASAADLSLSTKQEHP